MVARIYKPTRNQIARITAGDDRLTKAIERLFDTTNGVVFVSDKSDLPDAANGVITLDDGTIYSLTTTVDLLGDRLVAGENVVIEGWGTTVSKLMSTGLTGVAILTSAYGVTLRHLEIIADVALDLNGSAGQFLDWLSVNLTNCPTVGTIQNYDNFIGINIGLVNSAELVFDGIIGTIGFGDSFFLGREGQTTIVIPSTAVIARRFRVKFCAFVAPVDGHSVSFSEFATIPDENYIFFECNFSGGGIALSGVEHDDNRAMFTGNSGIRNSTSVANYYMTNNATATPVTVSTPTKALGATSANAVNERFSHADNRATYTGAISRVFEVQAWAALTSNNNNVLRLYVAKNGTALTTAFGEGTANAGGRAEGVSTASIVELETGDYVEVFVSNETGGNAVTDINLNVIVNVL